MLVVTLTHIGNVASKGHIQFTGANFGRQKFSMEDSYTARAKITQQTRKE